MGAHQVPEVVQADAGKSQRPALSNPPRSWLIPDAHIGSDFGSLRHGPPPQIAVMRTLRVNPGGPLGRSPLDHLLAPLRGYTLCVSASELGGRCQSPSTSQVKPQWPLTIADANISEGPPVPVRGHYRIIAVPLVTSGWLLRRVTPRASCITTADDLGVDTAPHR